MGNWRTVTIEGSIDPADAQAACNYNTGEDWDRFHCLAYYGPSLCGLGPWMPTDGGPIRAVGNLSERDYDVEDVAEAVRGLLGVAPSLRLKVHCGGDWESDVCVATVTCEGGTVVVGPAEVAQVGEGMSEMGATRLGAMLGLQLMSDDLVPLEPVVSVDGGTMSVNDFVTQLTAPDLVTWLRAQLDDDERIAQAAASTVSHMWNADPERWQWGGGGGPGEPLDLESAFEFEGQLRLKPFVDHIARHDPARVLAEVAAKRAILELHSPEQEACDWTDDGNVEPIAWESVCSCCAAVVGQQPWPCPTLRAVALPYADRSGYRDEWRPA